MHKIMRNYNEYLLKGSLTPMLTQLSLHWHQRMELEEVLDHRNDVTCTFLM